MFIVFVRVFIQLNTSLLPLFVWRKEGLLHTKMPPVPPAGPGGARGPSTFDKCKLLVRVVTCGLDPADRSNAPTIDLVTDSDDSEDGSSDGRLYVLRSTQGF